MFNLIVKVIFSSVLNTVTHITYMACFHFLQNVVRITHKTGFVLHAVESLRIKYFLALVELNSVEKLIH